MIGWQVALFILGLCILAVLLGLLAGFIILKIQKKPWPFAWPSTAGSASGGYAANTSPQITAEEVVIKKPQVSPGRESVKTETHSRPVTEMQAALQDFIKQRQAVAAAEEPLKPQKSDLLVEIETNLAVATAPWTGKLVAFQTKVLDGSRARIEALPQELKEQITEAYTDIHLANTLVWLSMDVGHRSKDLDESYMKLCHKIAERLEKVIPVLSRYGI